MNALIPAISGGVARTVLAYLAGRGIDVGDTAFAQSLEQGIQAALLLIPLLWSARQKHQADQTLKVAQIQAEMAIKANRIA